MGIIRQLPPSVINQIAAGEVVERPASVVKELLENAIDAEASRIDVTVERGGKDLIRVADNGRGMEPDDLPLAFLPHATSKLHEADDLFRIRTLGFRGEALAAIAEVSKVRCQSRQAEAAEGSEIAIDAGVTGPVRRLRLPPRDRLRGAQPVPQHARPTHVPEVGLDRGGARRRDVRADRAWRIRPSGSRSARRASWSTTCRPSPASRSGSPSFSARSWPTRSSGSRAGSSRSTSGAMWLTRRRAAPVPRGSSSSSGAVTSATGRSATRWRRPTGAS